MNDKLKALAEKIREAARIPENENFGSVIAILMIISIMLTTIRVLQECNKNKLNGNSTAQDKYNLYHTEIKQYCLKRGWFTKMKIRKIIRQQMSKEQYNKYGQDLLQCLLNEGEVITEEDVATLVESAYV